MDFNDTPEEAAFRKEVRAWLDANATRKSDDRQSFRARNDDPELLKKAKAWQDKKAQAGYARITWPKEYRRPRRLAHPAGDLPAGGSELSGAAGLLRYRARHVHPDHDGLCRARASPALREARAARPRSVVPALLRAGGRLRRGRHPHQGRARRRRLGDQRPEGLDLGRALQRLRHHRSRAPTPMCPKHAGLTMFFLSMKTPGVEVRPIKQMSGGASFNEVFFTDVRLPDSQRAGQGGRGLEGGPHHADERAAGGRPALGRPRRRRADGARRATPTSRTGRRSATSRSARRSPTGTSSSRA